MRDVLPIVVVLFVLLLIASAVALGIVFWGFGSADQTVGTVLIYRIDQQSWPSPAPSEMQRLIAAIDARVNPGWSGQARVRGLDGGRIEVSVLGNDPEKAERIERLLQHIGSLEFRILANGRDHKDLIERARAEDSQQVLNEAGDVLAWWVPVRRGQESGFLNDPEVVRRTKTRDAGEVLEVLVVSDLFDVTGDYLERAEPSVDQSGRPCLAFTFTGAGGRLFGGLTSNNLPDPAGDFTRKLGIILNGHLYSAPAIMSTITTRGEISGLFTREEVQEMTDVLNAGPLPVAIEQVEKRQGGIAR